jgi:hypothetical protein
MCALSWLYIGVYDTLLGLDICSKNINLILSSSLSFSYSNASSINVTLTKTLDLLPHGARSIVFWKQFGVVNAIMMNGEVWW